MPESPDLLQVVELHKHFPVLRGVFQRQVDVVRALDGVSFSVRRGETFGLVGESGCGKTTLAYTILQLYRQTSGKVLFDGVDLAGLSHAALRQARRRLQMIFQDPYASLNPRLTVRETLVEPLEAHGVAVGQAADAQVRQLLAMVQLNADMLSRYPHEFSGGQRQRVGIARALALHPDLLVCDEPISALDVSIQAQIVNLLEDLQDQLGLTYVLIAHDLAMVRYLSRRVAVMYLGIFVEMAPADELYSRPLHPYTQALLSSVPIPDPVVEQTRQRIVLEGEAFGVLLPQGGCRFRARCPLAAGTALCAEVQPEFREVAAGHWVACHKV